MTKTSLDKDKIKILLLEGIHPSATEKFQADGYRNIEHHQKALRSAELESAAAESFVALAHRDEAFRPPQHGVLIVLLRFDVVRLVVRIGIDDDRQIQPVWTGL